MMISAYKFLIRQAEGKIPCERRKHLWGYTINKTAVRCEDLEWINLAQGRVHLWSVVNAVMRLCVA
jgi:hypothetical protein